MWSGQTDCQSEEEVEEEDLRRSIVKLLKGDNLIILLFSLFLELNYWFVAYCVTNNIISIRHAKVVVEVYEK